MCPRVTITDLIDTTAMLERDPKRRRLTPLNAPFRSPLHRSSGERAGSSANPSKSSNLNGSKSLPNTPVRRLPPRQFKSPVLGRNDEGGLTPDVLALIHRKRELEAQIKAEKNSIETAQLALKYEKQVVPYPLSLHQNIALPPRL